jgi:hypothetical protein
VKRSTPLVCDFPSALAKRHSGEVLSIMPQGMGAQLMGGRAHHAGPRRTNASAALISTGKPTTARNR